MRDRGPTRARFTRIRSSLSGLVAVLSFVGCGDRPRPDGPARRDAAPAGPRASLVRFEWPPYVADVDPSTPGDQPFFDVKAPDPSRTDAGRREVRVHVTPPVGEKGVVVPVVGVSFLGPPGSPLAATAARVDPASLGWTTTRSPDGAGYDFRAGEGRAPIPLDGIRFVFAMSAETLEKARWRDVRVLLLGEGMTPVGAAYRVEGSADGQSPPHGIMLPFSAD